MEQKWQPIETAPKDKSQMLLWDGEYVTLGSWCLRGYWLPAEANDFSGPGWEPSHWTPLPHPPSRVVWSCPHDQMQCEAPGCRNTASPRFDPNCVRTVRLGCFEDFIGLKDGDRVRVVRDPTTATTVDPREEA
jgi:hypothetical protein